MKSRLKVHVAPYAARPSRGLRASLFAVAFCASLALAAAFPSEASARQLPFDRGMNGGNIFDTAAQQQQSINYMQQLGSRWIRINVHWEAAEQNGKGQYNPAIINGINGLIARARAAGMQVVLTNGATPSWASKGCPTVSTCKPYSGQYPPKNNQDFADFMRYLASQHVGQGIFYQIWNEPNIKAGWYAEPYTANPAGYTDMLKKSSVSIRQVDPGARIMVAGLSQTGVGSGGMPAYKFLQRIYDYGGKPYFESVSNHVYPKGSTRDPYSACPATITSRLRAICGIRDVYAIMQKNGDGHKYLYITEFGYTTYTGVYKVSEAEQAVFLQRALNKVFYDHPYVRMAAWYRLNDVATNQRNIRPEAYLDNFGLLRGNLSGKPSYNAFRTWAPGAGGVPAPPLARFIHYYSSSITSHYYSTNPATPSGYSKREVVGRLYGSQANGSAPLYRLYKGSIRAHYYTMSKRERDRAAANNFYGYRPGATDPIAGYMFTKRVSNTYPLYDAYSNRTRSHYYTMSKNELNAARAGSNRYSYRGITGYMFKD